MKEELLIRIYYCIIGYLVLKLVQVAESVIDLIKQEKPIDLENLYAPKIRYSKDDILYHVDTINQRNNIPIDQRRVGMIVYVVETDCSYMLETNPITRYTLNRDWCKVIRSTDSNGQECTCLY